MAESTGCKQEELAEEVWQYFARPAAWTIAPQAIRSLQRIRAAGAHTHPSKPRPEDLAALCMMLCRSCLLRSGGLTVSGHAALTSAEQAVVCRVTHLACMCSLEMSLAHTDRF